MLLITIELISARTRERTILHRGYLINDGTGDAEHGNYKAKFGRKGTAGIIAGREAYVEGFPRKRLNAWRLLQRALNAAYDDR